jgi:hypothetical protein
MPPITLRLLLAGLACLFCWHVFMTTAVELNDPAPMVRADPARRATTVVKGAATKNLLHEGEIASALEPGGFRHLVMERLSFYCNAHPQPGPGEPLASESVFPSLPQVC